MTTAELAAAYTEKANAVFSRFAQSIGKPTFYNEMPGGTRHLYKPFGWQSSIPERIVSRIESLASDLAGKGVHTIVWRNKPQFDTIENGNLAFYCRFHTLPYLELEPSKPEGAPFPEA